MRGAAGRRCIRFADELVNMAVLAAIMSLFVYGCYAIWDSGQVYDAAGAVRYEAYKPSADNGVGSFQNLQAINPEVSAWLTVYGTHIDYPVAQSDNNMKYINTDAKGKYSLSGSIFLDSRSSPDFSDFSSIIYGHHMDKQTMFGEIGLFSDKGYFDERAYGSLYYGGQEHGLVFFAFVHADAYDNTVFRTKIAGRDEQQAYLNMLVERAVHIRGDVPISADDRIVLLSTCSASSTNGRDILIGKITDTVYADSFKTKLTGAITAIPVINALPGIWTQMPLYILAGAGAAIFLLILLAVLIYIIKKKKRSER